MRADLHTDAPIESLEAFLAFLKGKSDDALLALEEFDDPQSIRRRLAILIDVGRLTEAVALVDRLQPRREWADLAVFVYANQGQLDKAADLLSWVKEQRNLNLLFRASVRFAWGAMGAVQQGNAEGYLATPATLTQAQRPALVNISAKIEPACEVILARGTVEVEVESVLLQVYLDLLYLLGAREKAVRVFDTLLTRTPLPLCIGKTLLNGIGEPSRELALRLWKEQAESFEAGVVSCLILGRLLSEVKTARAQTVLLAPRAHSKEEREQVCELFYEFASSDDDYPFADVEQFVGQLIGPDSRLLRLFRADHLVRENRHADALHLLESIKDDNDPLWLRAMANANEHAGHHAEALEAFKRIGAKAPTPDVLWATARLAKDQGRLQDEREALALLVALDPRNSMARRRLAMILAGVGEYEKAAEHLEVLASSHETVDENVLINLAVSHTYAGHVDKALSVLVAQGSDSALPLPLLKTRALILQGAGRAADARNELMNARDIYGGEPDFLLTLMNIAYAVGDERGAHDALVKLHTLREEGRVDEKLMRRVSLAEVRGWIENVAKRQDSIRSFLLEGKFPWLLAAQIQGEAPYWAWLLKTQSMEWIFDDRLNRAYYCIYSTNSFRVLEGPEAGTTLEYVTCPGRDASIVVDLSALLTLHSLDLLKTASDYFGTLMVPAVYLSKVIDDTRKLLPHQLSQRNAARDILKAISENRVKVLNTEWVSAPDLTEISEYVGDDAKNSARPLRDLLNAMSRAGLLTDRELGEAEAVAHRPATEKSLAVGGAVLISESTLVTLHGLGLLDLVSSQFIVSISHNDHVEIAGRARAYEALQEAYSKHTQLWNALRTNPRVQFVSAAVTLELEDEDKEAEDLAVAALQLARARGVPLLADDRVCQMFVLNEQRGDRTAAFGTDCFVVSAHQAGVLDKRAAAQAYLKLMEWRYRFLVMPAELLKEIADQYRSHPPGLAMRRIAKYIHESMSDPGLFGGLEATSTPTSVAVRLYQSWAQNIAELLMDIWADATASEAYAEEFTSWALTEMLPSPPRVAAEDLQARISGLTSLTVFSRALIRASDYADFDRTNVGLRAIASTLGLTDDEYFGLVARVTGTFDD